MTIRIGITGHMNLAVEAEQLVEDHLRELLKPSVALGLVGVSCIAAGSDSIFARVVLELGGEIEVVLPASSYRSTKVSEAHARTFDELLEKARLVHVMPFEESNREAYEAANAELLERSDELVAVWDGQAPMDRAGTASVVRTARSIALPLRVVWPDGAERR